MAKRDRADTKGTPVYDEDTKFTLKFFHGGEMIESLSRYYRGGFVDYFDGVDGDMLGLIEMNDFAKQLGYEEQNIRFWHQYGHSLYRGAKILSSDSDVLDIMKFIPLNREVLIYIEHLNHPQPMQPSCLPSSLPSTLHEDEEPVLDFSFLDDINTATPQTEEHFDPIVEHNSDGHSDSDDSDVLIDSEYDMMEDDRLYEKYVDHDVEFVGLGKSSHPLKNMLGDEVSSRLEGDTLEPVNSSDELESLVGSDEDDLCMPKYPKYNPTTDSRKPALKLGLVFSTKAEAKSAIETYCFRAGKSIFFDRNDSRRLRARCKTDGCEWKAYVAPMQHGSTWQVKVFNDEHTNCAWSYNNSAIKSTWVGKHFMKEVKKNPKIQITGFREHVCSKLKANISKHQAYRARIAARRLLEGDVKEQYSKLRDYCAELLRSNPGSTVVLKLIENEGVVNQFHRFYVCFKACKEGFKACRKVVGVDGCFLKGCYGGQLLTACGIDPNNNMFPIAWAVVEAETKDSWLWFLSLLGDDIGISEAEKWTFMSDKQKGLIPAFESLFPEAENRFCVQHLHSNMKKDGFLGLAIKKELWAAARCTRVEEFKARMDKLKSVDPKAYEWLVKKPPNQWSRSHFSLTPKCDILTNNMCESFNSLILSAREKHIIGLLDTVRNIMMARMHTNREQAKKWDGCICPRIKMILDGNMKKAGELIPMRSDEWNFQIMGPFEQHTVDVLGRSCSCRKWELTGLPCKHAISAIWCRKEEPGWYVDHLYTVETYRKAYELPILGINGPDLWPNVELPPPIPPAIVKRPGRPKKARRRNPTEPPSALPHNPLRLKKHQRSVTCRVCGEHGHNARKHKKADQNEEQEEIPVSESQPPPATDNVFSSQSLAPTPANNNNDVEASRNRSQEKTRTTRKRKSSQLDGNGNEDQRQTVNVTQSEGVTCPVVVKGGVNYITVSNIRSALRPRNGAAPGKDKAANK